MVFVFCKLIAARSMLISFLLFNPIACFLIELSIITLISPTFASRPYFSLPGFIPLHLMALTISNTAAKQHRHDEFIPPTHRRPIAY